ncbi:MAG: toll/interleukin-1 receptor domain-containing protein [Vicinamibacterales bacterium]
MYDPIQARDVFVAHAAEDSATALELAAKLEEHGVTCWLAPRDVAPSRLYAESLYRAIEAAPVFIVLISKAANNSTHVARELEIADQMGRRVVPVRLEDFEATGAFCYYTRAAHFYHWHEDRAGVLAKVTDQVTSARAGLPATGSSDNSHGSTPRLAIDRAGIKRALRLSLASAWIGSIALAVTVAYDFGVTRTAVRLWSVAYSVTLLSFLFGACASVVLGVQSLRQGFVPGTLQGLLWPGVAAVGQLVAFTLAANLLKSLPFVSEFEGLLAFVVCGTFGPAGLTYSAMTVTRAIDRASRRLTG